MKIFQDLIEQRQRLTLEIFEIDMDIRFGNLMNDPNQQRLESQRERKLLKKERLEKLIVIAYPNYAVGRVQERQHDDLRDRPDR